MKFLYAMHNIIIGNIIHVYINCRLQENLRSCLAFVYKLYRFTYIYENLSESNEIFTSKLFEL